MSSNSKEVGPKPGFDESESPVWMLARRGTVMGEKRHQAPRLAPSLGFFGSVLLHCSPSPLVTKSRSPFKPSWL